MPKATLSYTLPEDNYEYECARRGQEAFSAIDEIRKAIRSHRKYDMPLKEAFDEIVGILSEVGDVDG